MNFASYRTFKFFSFDKVALVSTVTHRYKTILQKYSRLMFFHFSQNDFFYIFYKKLFYWTYNLNYFKVFASYFFLFTQLCGVRMFVPFISRSVLFVALFLKNSWNLPVRVKLNHLQVKWRECLRWKPRFNKESLCSINKNESRKKIHICTVTVFSQQFSLKAFAFNRVQRIHRHLFLIRLTTCAARRFKIQTSFSTRHYTIHLEKKNHPKCIQGIMLF